MTSMAIPAMPSAASSLPALKPNQPTQSMLVPTTVRTRLWGSHGLCRVADARADHDTDNQCGDTGIDMHDRASGKIKDSPAGEQAAAPGHMPDRYIAEGEPDNHEDQHGAELHPLGKGSNDERRGDDRKSHLEGQEDRLGYGAIQGVNSQVLEKEFGGVSYYGVPLGGGKAIAVDDPQQGHDAGHCQALTKDREDVLCPDEAAIE